ncbi:hypothetical protein FHS21_004585 [Phyllobacterium trifolii]|jgi:hypothetical protein|uniref:Uncharacterized protein n=1 Tax=Phyllobacterium trifolii TaxID=300193 RepID=A0A839UH71_9HYPH|nr:hypothetical protein [Phyllobacterium trifolii]
MNNKKLERHKYSTPWWLKIVVFGVGLAVAVTSRT